MWIWARGIIERRYEYGDEGIMRYGEDGEKATIKGLLESMSDEGRLTTRDSGPTMAIERVPVFSEEEEYWDNIYGQRLDAQGS